MTVGSIMTCSAVLAAVLVNRNVGKRSTEQNSAFQVIMFRLSSVDELQVVMSLADHREAG